MAQNDPVADVDKVTERLEFLFAFHTEVEVDVDVYQQCIDIGGQGLHCCLDCKVLQVTDTPKVNQTRLLLLQVLHNTISLPLHGVTGVIVEGQQVCVGNAIIPQTFIHLSNIVAAVHRWQLAIL